MVIQLPCSGLKMVFGLADAAFAVDFLSKLRPYIGESQCHCIVSQNSRIPQTFNPQLPVLPAHDMDGILNL
ncbi:hypothetical protein D3C80_1547220 [compost metagenome]